MIIQHEDLRKLREKYKDKKIVYCSGSFDLVHLGHALLFKKCKKFGDILVVNVGCDYDISNRKPGRPILPQSIRLRTVNELKSVDYCFLGKQRLSNDNSQARVIEIFESLRPDIYIATNDVSDMDYRRKVARDHGIRLVVISPVLPSLTTSSIIDKIKKDK